MFWLDDRFTTLTKSPQLESFCRQQLRILLHEFTIEIQEMSWICEGIQPNFLEDTKNLTRINGQQIAVRIGLPEPVNQGEPGIFPAILCYTGDGLPGRISIHRLFDKLAPRLKRTRPFSRYFFHFGNSFNKT